ncbi:hypothetical protein DAMA08_017290 [Martiniozyma asiatica (nom. inval.)]|nr:hypothetical protein DAMA08_017290 [Martiniozyma asiatica]
MLVPSSFAIGANYFGHDKKKLTFAMIGLYLALVASLGTDPLIGGALAVPIEKAETHNRLSLKSINYVGMFLFVAGLLLIILGLSQGGNNWNSLSAYVPLPLGVLVIVGVIAFEILYMENFRGKHTAGDVFINGNTFQHRIVNTDSLFPN